MVTAFEMTAEATISNSSLSFKWFQSEVAQYARQIKASGPAQAKVEMESAVMGECPVLTGEGFAPRT